MNKKAAIIGIVIIAIAAGIAVSFSVDSEDMSVPQQYHGDISTALGSPILGDPNAAVTIVEFGDYQCHACHAWFLHTKPALTKDYIDTGKVNLVFVDLAFLGRDSPKAAQASYCALDQDMYWEYHDLLYHTQEPQIDSWAGTERLKALAFALNLDMEQFDQCLDSGKYSKRVQTNTGEARKAGARSTPTFFIVGPDAEQKIVGAQPYSIFQQVIDSMI